MTASNQSPNSYIEEYLDYYCGLSPSPGFAILLKGEWGVGKTWFIEKYRQKLESNNQKCLYVSLYGMTKFSDIEDSFFQQLHPFLASKGFGVASKIAKALLKGTFNFDFNNDAKNDGVWRIELPNIGFEDFFKDANKRILIFDDLERCQIDLKSLRGYVTSFVEHQGQKSILLANEDELTKNNDQYPTIKEKLIGKTFEVALDLESSLKEFVLILDNEELKNLFIQSNKSIENLYEKAKYKNLRSLKQIILDFMRLYENLPEKAKGKSEILQELLEFLISFSIEIQRGSLFPKEISALPQKYAFRQDKENLSKSTNSVENEDYKSILLQEIVYRYLNLPSHRPLLQIEWWQSFFDRGIIDSQELEISVLNSQYFFDENTPDWVKLHHFPDLNDDEFEDLFEKVKSAYANREFHDIGEVIHVFGLYLMLSEIAIYSESKEAILESAKDYIKYLDNRNVLFSVSSFWNKSLFFEVYRGLSFWGKEFSEFQAMKEFMKELRESERTKNIPNLFEIMEKDPWKFYGLISLSAYSSQDESEFQYYKTSIFKHEYISECDFMKKLLSLNPKHQQIIFWSIENRYENDQFNTLLVDELDWIKSFQKLLLEKVN